MGWFWADTPATQQTQLPPSHPHLGHGSDAGAQPPAGCPMHKADNSTISNFMKRPADTSSSSSSATSPPSSCPVPHDKRPPSACPVNHNGSSSPTPDGAPPTDAERNSVASLNPLNYMFRDISQKRAPDQQVALPTSRDASSIPRGDGTGATWEYPSPQQMYNALLRKGHTDTDATAVESMVAVHNFLNEGAWNEIVDWERRFGRGLAKGWEISKKGEENADLLAAKVELLEGKDVVPTLERFQGRPGDMTPKAAFVQLMARLYPAKYGTPPPFDRHDWYVTRSYNGHQRQVRYVIDFYSGEPDPHGEPVFYLDVRPAMTVTGAAERLMRWGGDVWWRASGGPARENPSEQFAKWRAGGKGA